MSYSVLLVESWKAIKLWGEAITVKAMAPSEAHTKVCLVTLHLNPSNGRGENSIHLLNRLPPSRETLHHLQAELGDLDDYELQQFMEDLWQEIALCKVNMPPSSPL